LALTTQAEIEKRLQWNITAEPDSVVTSLIAAATGHIEGAIGRKVESANYTETYDADMNPILLEHWPVTTLSTVTEDNTTLTSADYAFYDDGRLLRISNGYVRRWSTRKVQSIDVTYTGGYLAGTHVSELAHIGSIATEIVARAFRAGAASAVAPAGVGLGGIASVSLAGSDSVTYSTVGGESFQVGGGLTRFVQILEDEKTQLQQYRDLV
jgi:hypothetical protein